MRAICSRANYLRDNFRGSNFLGPIIQGAIILVGQLSGEQLSRGPLSRRQLSEGAIVLFSVLLSNMFCGDFSVTDYCYFITHIKWDVIISSSLRLLLKVWIWYRCQNRMENYYHHDGEQLGFYIKYLSKHRAGCSSDLFKQRIPIYLTKNCTQENSKYHIQNEESWLRWIVLEQVNYYFLLKFPERNCVHTFRASSEKVIVCILWKWRQNAWRRMCERVFSLTCRLTSRKLIIG